MTLMVAQISKYGIVFATDSNLTSDENTHLREAQKVFAIPHLNAALTVAGSYSIGEQSLDQWVNRHIQAEASLHTNSLRLFAERLKTSLEGEMFEHEKRRGSMIHLAGYVDENHAVHPEFYFIRNVGLKGATGEYVIFDGELKVSEDFWRRDFLEPGFEQDFENGAVRLYGNGFVAGRIGFFSLMPVLHRFFTSMWDNPNWKFRRPHSVEEQARYIRLYMDTIVTLFQCSCYEAREIGGHIQTLVIRAPTT